jgi:Ser/Thr protein kinase RdoA (MazF antagonist)
MRMEARTPIAATETSEVFGLDDLRVLKLYRRGWPREAVEREARAARAAHAAGVAAPAVLELVQEGDRTGIVFQRVAGTSMLELLRERPADGPRLGARLAELHAAVHERRTDGLPSQRDWLRGKIQRARPLDDARRRRVLTALDRLEDADAMCHGDLHPANVLVGRGAAAIVDWLDAARGNPLADVARTSLVLRHATLPGGVELTDSFRTAFHDAYLARYRELRAVESAELDAWYLPVAASRLSEKLSPGEHPRWLALVDRQLATEPG